MPKVSVIVPVHNSVDYLAECLVSIERQTLADIEVICVDDASTDASMTVLDMFASDDERYRKAVFGENRGAAAARNEGMRLAKGDYLIFVDNDDWLPSDDVLEKLYRAAIETDADVVGGSLRYYDHREDKLLEPDGQGSDFLLMLEQEGYLPYGEWQGDEGVQRFLFKRNFLEGQGLAFPDFSYESESAFLVRALVAAGGFMAVPEVVYHRRVKHHTRFFDDHELDGMLEGIAEKLGFAQQYGFDRLKQAQVARLREWSTRSFGLILAEPGMLKARSRLLKGVANSSFFRHALDIAASYRSFASDAVKQMNVD